GPPRVPSAPGCCCCCRCRRTPPLSDHRQGSAFTGRPTNPSYFSLEDKRATSSGPRKEKQHATL
ncbi:mCG16962, partial [Mus musculus]